MNPLQHDPMKPVNPSAESMQYGAPLRSDLIILPRTDHQGKAWFLVEDPDRRSFHRLGLSEYELLLAFDGNRTLDEARQLVASRQPQLAPISAGQAESLVRFAANHHLLSTCNRFNHATAPSKSRPWRGPRWVLVSQDHDWSWLNGSLSRLLSWPCMLAVAMASLLVLMLVANDWVRFSQDAKQQFQPDRLWTIGLVWILLKLVHELGHLSAAVRFGCRPGEMGFTWMILAPVAYVDLTDTYRLTSRRQRIVISLAGVYFELIVACVAMIAWSSSERPSMQPWFVSLAIAASVGTLLFNLNPLMRLDGYHALADWFDRPQLALDGQRAVGAWCKRIVFGQVNRDSQSDSLAVGYGFASLTYRCTLMWGLVSAAASMYGTHVAFAVAGFLVIVVAAQAARIVGALVAAIQTRPAIIVRCGVIVAACTIPITVAGWAWQNRQAKFYGIVEYADDAPLRAGCDGSLIRVLVDDQQWVQQGQPLMELQNLKLVATREQMERELEAAEIRVLQLRQLKRVSEEQAELRLAEAIRQRLESLRQQQAGLVILAPRNGMVLFDELKQCLGAWYREGDVLVRVVDPQKKRVIAAVPASLADDLGTGMQVGITTSNIDGQTLAGHVRQFASKASHELAHPALSARAGGPLAVYDTIDQQPARTSRAYIGAEIELHDPLDELRPGQSVAVRVLNMVR